MHVLPLCGILDAERPEIHSHTERGNENLTALLYEKGTLKFNKKENLMKRTNQEDDHGI
jgi:hypothetical protein